MSYYIISIGLFVASLLSLLLIPMTMFGSAPLTMFFIFLTAVTLLKHTHSNPYFLTFRRINLWLWFGAILSIIGMIRNFNNPGEGFIFVILMVWLAVTIYFIVAYLSPKNLLLADEDKEKRFHFYKGIFKILLIVIIFFGVIVPLLTEVYRDMRPDRIREELLPWNLNVKTSK